MGIEGIYWGYGIEISLSDLGTILNIDVANVDMDAFLSLDTINYYLENNKIQNMNFCVLPKSHVDYDSDDDSDDDPKNNNLYLQKNIYFGIYVKIGNYDCWSATNISQNIMDKIQNIPVTDVNNVCNEMFGKDSKLMLIVLGCPCCS